ncbi:MAG TPA: PQQ-dependent sugar dehydrogenase [Bryobacteraceae bacterium]|nr:PQQ-dependent sugar dehydrogenase [Bryobacteraceae bacterium]
MKNSVVASTLTVAALTGSLLAWQQDAFKLPPPYHTPNASNGAKVVPKPENAHLRLPDGFSAEEFASGFQKPRIMLELPNGDVLVSDSVQKGAVVHLSKGNRRNLIEGLDRPYGLALNKDFLYVAEPLSVKRYKLDAKKVSVGPGEEVVSLAGFDKGHWTRALTFSPKGDKLYIGVGSGSNASPDTDERRATILECNPDGSNCTIFAAGLRNATAINFRPGTTELWATVQERDGLGDDLVPDFFAHVKRGSFYGWPWAYFGSNEDPRNAGQKPDLVKKTAVPEVSLGAHTAVIDWKFYTGKQFPAKYHGGAFFALRGSSNRAKRVGYSVVYLPFDKSGKPARQVEDFLSGWMMGPDQREVWGRPTGVLQLRDGSLLVSEDGNNRIWRVTYGKAAAMLK